MMIKCEHSIGPDVDAVGPALGRQSDVFHVAGRRRWVCVVKSVVGLYTALTLVHITISYNLEIKLVKSFSVFFNKNSHSFVF